MSLWQSEQAKIEELTKSFDHEFASFKNKCILMQQSAKKGKEFYGAFLDSLLQINQILEEYARYYDTEKDKFVSDHGGAEAQLKRDSDFLANSETFLKNQQEELVKKRKHLEKVRTTMRAAIGNVKASKLSKLRVPEKPFLKNLFQIIFSVLYRASKEEFVWEKFKKIALLQDNCDDFISRAAALDPLDVPQNQLEDLNKVRTDGELMRFASEDPNGDTVLDIIDYLEYIPECRRVEEEINKLEGQLKTIKRDSFTRKAKVEVTKKRIEILEGNYNELADLNKRILDSKSWVDPLVKEVQQKIKDLEGYSTKLTQEIQGIYEREIQKVPNSCYE